MAFGIPSLAAHHAVVAIESPRGSALATLAGMIGSFCIAPPLIYMYGVMGAAIAVLVGTAIECVGLVVIFRLNMSEWNWRDDAEPAARQLDRSTT
jgi:Na+-driven multidrug efflux pump